MLVAALAVTGCTTGDRTGDPGADSGDTSPTRSAAVSDPAATPGVASTDRASEVASAVSDLLAARDRAVLAGDRRAFADTVARPDSADGARQLATFRAAHRLGLVRLTHDVVAPVDDPSAVDVTLRYRVEGVDRADRTTRVRYRVTDRQGRWLVDAERTADTGAAAPWLAMPDLAVRRTDHALVAGTADAPALAEAARTVDDVLPRLARQWQRTPERTLVLLPATPEEADALTGASSAAPGTVAALTDGPVDDSGRATGDRVVLDPTVHAALTPVGREVVLTHELAHVAVRATVPGEPPLWLAEGYADHVGYAVADLPQRTLAAPLLDAVRTGTAPTVIPTADTLDPQLGDIEVGYLAAWQVAETVVDLAGETGLRELVRACASTGGEAEGEATCTAMMPATVGIGRDGLTRRWRDRVEGLAR